MAPTAKTAMALTVSAVPRPITKVAATPGETYGLSHGRLPCRCFCPASRRDFVQVLVLMVGLWLVATSVVSVLPQRLLAHIGQSPVWVTTVLLAAQPVVIGGFVAAGMTSQKVGRRRALALGAAPLVRRRPG